MRVFEIATPDGRKVRHAAEDVVQAKSRLVPGYSVSGEVIGADEGLDGGYVIPLQPGESPLAILLKLYGDDLLAWLGGHGFQPVSNGD